MPLRFAALLFATNLTACALYHPLVGITGLAGDGDDDPGLSLLLLALLGSGAGVIVDTATGDSSGGSTSTTTTVLKWLYSGNNGSNIGMFAVDDSTGLLTEMTPATIAAGSNPWYPTAHPDSTFLYVPNRSGGNISQFSIDQSTGLLNSLSPATVSTTAGDPLTMIVHPNGQYAYAGFNSAAGIDMFLVGSDGLLTLNATPNLAGCATANELVVHPNGNFLYALCSNTVQRHTINADGTLTHLGNSAVGGSQANGMTITADGAYLYATSQGADTVRAFSVNGSTGDLTTVGTYPTSTWANEVVVDAANSYVYVNCWNGASENVRQYIITPGTGALTDNTPNNVATGGTQPLGMNIDPLGRYVFVANTSSNTINQYSVDASTGQLTSNGLLPTTASGPRGLAPVAVQVTQ